MESNGYEHQLFRAVEALSTIANQAYWKKRQDCDSDYNADTCADCDHSEVCKADVVLKQAIDTLAEWEC